MGEYFTALEMAGFSLTVSVLDDERARLLDAPADTVGLRVGKLSGLMADNSTVQVRPSQGIGAAAAAIDVVRVKPRSHSADQSATDAAVYSALVAIAKNMPHDREHLCRLDAALGDGDHGVSIAKTFRAVDHRLLSLSGDSAKTILTEAADTILTEVGGAMDRLSVRRFSPLPNTLAAQTTLDLARRLSPTPFKPPQKPFAPKGAPGEAIRRC